MRTIAGPMIMLASGNYFDFANPENSVFTIEDIAYGLSNICRFVGQCKRFYSVAQHSVCVSRIVPPEHAYAGLMHDAAEAFIGDVSRPLKDILPEYRVIESRVERAVFSHFDVPFPLPREVKDADAIMLATEQAHIMRCGDNWSVLNGVEPVDIELPECGPRRARVEFLDQFYRLRPQKNCGGEWV